MIALALLLLAPLQAVAQQPQYARHHWDTRDGLPQNSILDIDQSDDGTLLLATNGGLALFDGKTFRSETLAQLPILGTSRIMQVATGPQGQTALGTNEGRVLVLEDSAWSQVTLPGNGMETVNGLAYGPDGGLWITSVAGLFHQSPGKADAFLDVSGPFSCLDVASDGSAYVGGPEGLLRIAKDGRTRLRGEPVQALIRCGDGELFAGSFERLQRWNGDNWETLPVDVGGILDLMEDNGERLWVSGREGLGYWDLHQETWTAVETGMPDGMLLDLKSLFQDRDRNVWVGTKTRGLFALSPSPLRAFQPPSPSKSILSIATTTEGGVYALNAKLWKVTDGRFQEVPGPTPHLMATSRAGGLWLSSDLGVSRFVASERRLVIPAEDLALGLGSLLETADGSLLIARDGWLFRWQAGTLHRTDLTPFSIDPEIVSLHEDSRGRIWIGSLRGLCVLDGEVPWVLRSGEDIPLGSVRCFYETPAGAMWVGTYGGGLVRIMGKDISVLNVANGLHENTASALTPDGSGRLLVLGNRAIASYDLDELEAAATDPAVVLWGQVYDSGPGIDILEGNGVRQPRSAVDAHGAIWMPTLDGVVRFSRGNAPQDPHPPSTSVNVAIPGSASEESTPDGDTHIHVRPDDRTLRFEYVATTFTRPRQVRYRYRLLGHETEWQASDVEGTVSYNNLAPGDYVFQIKAASFGGAFGPLNTRFTLDVEPTLFERPWARRLLALTGLALLLMAGRLRVRNIRRRSEELELTVLKRTTELQGEVEERQLAEQRLREAGEKLEDQVKERTERLTLALRSLELDVQRRKELEGRLRESEKLEAVGRLAGGLAHDFNNILTAILGESDLGLAGLEEIAEDEGKRGALARSLGNIHDAGMRAARLTRQLLAYSRQQVMQPRVLRPMSIMAELHEMLIRLLPDNVELVLEGRFDCPPILIDPGHLEQVFVNLVVNAAEAMPDGGVIRVSCAVDTKEGGARFTRICIRDSGVGLSDEDRQRIFEPFYSTKGQSRGLGLASVHGIIEQSGGSIEVESTPGKGTAFHASFPATDRAPERLAVEIQSSLPQGVVALLVDDQEDVRSVSRQLLEMGGVTVFEADSPAQALELAQLHRDALSILITDVVMPEMNGRQLSDAVRKICPDICVLFISGHVAAELTERDLISGGANLLSKPFGSKQLLGRVAELTGQDRRSAE